MPPPEGDRATELLQDAARSGERAGGETESRTAQFFRPDVDVRQARHDSARALIVTGTERAPRVILNGKPLPGPFGRFVNDGTAWFRVPIVAGE